MQTETKELTPEQREKRRKKNKKRSEQRKRAAERAKLPPIVGLSRQQFADTFGFSMELDAFSEMYDRYADRLLAEAKAKGRKCEFPLEPLGGVYFPSRVKHRKGGCCGE